MYVWPDHFPHSCPPVDAIDVSGPVYRFINGRAPADRDFESHYERNAAKDWDADACVARGLSVLRNWSDCMIMRKAVPALRKKRVAVAMVVSPVGLIAPTPSNSCAGHCTWWRSLAPGQVRPLFSTFQEPSEASHE